jgi:hypothetical protein
MGAHTCERSERWPLLWRVSWLSLSYRRWETGNTLFVHRYVFSKGTLTVNNVQLRSTPLSPMPQSFHTSIMTCLSARQKKGCIRASHRSIQGQFCLEWSCTILPIPLRSRCGIKFHKQLLLPITHMQIWRFKNTYACQKGRIDCVRHLVYISDL